MAENTNVGMAVFIADITSMCGFGMDGAAVLLSACSFFRCCNHQFVFSCLEVLFFSIPPLCAICRKTLPGHSGDVDSLHISYADIFMGKAHKNCIIGQKCCLHHITGTAFIIRLKLYAYIVENSETFQKIYSFMHFK